MLLGGAYELLDFVASRLSQVLDALSGKTPRVSAELCRARLESCRKCPIFFAPLQTCGSPLQDGPRVCGRQPGCYCFMPLKARYECNCWLWEEIQDHRLDPAWYHWQATDGWQGELNTDYDQSQSSD